MCKSNKKLSIAPNLAALSLLTLAFAAAADPGPGDLLVAPTRVIFEPSTRNAEITLVNLGQAPATYRIGFVQLRMDENGGTREIAVEDAEPGESFAADLLRFSPRQVRLEPKVAQVVRLQLRKSPSLAAGEYRSHLLIRAIPENAEPAPGASLASGVAVQLQVVYGISIPVIVRHGETFGAARLAELELVPPAKAGAPPSLAFRIERSGNQSLFGNLVATFEPRGGQSVVLGRAAGVAVYTPNLFRTARLGLQIPAAVRDLAGNLRLRYLTPDEEILAEAELPLH